MLGWKLIRGGNPAQAATRTEPPALALNSSRCDRGAGTLTDWLYSVNSLDAKKLEGAKRSPSHRHAPIGGASLVLE